MNTNDLRDWSQQCRHCHKLVVWIDINGSRIPIDLEPGDRGNVAVYSTTIPQEAGHLVALHGNVVGPSQATGMRGAGQATFVQHAETCQSGGKLGIRPIRPSTVIKRGARR